MATPDLDGRLSQKLQNHKAWTKAWIAMHAERAYRPDNPAHMRLADLAIALAPANGHVNVRPGDLMTFLGVKDRRTLDRAIADAVLYGSLAPGSSARCLILPTAVDGFCIRKNPNARATEQERSCAVCHAARPANPCANHADRPVHAKGLCNACYRAKLRAESGTTKI